MLRTSSELIVTSSLVAARQAVHTDRVSCHRCLEPPVSLSLLLAWLLPGRQSIPTAWVVTDAWHVLQASCCCSSANTHPLSPLCIALWTDMTGTYSYRTKLSFPAHTWEIVKRHVETAQWHAVGMDYQEDPWNEARPAPAVAIRPQEVASICDSAVRSPTWAEAETRQ